MNCALIAVLWIMFLPGMAFCSSPDPVSLADVYRARPFKPFVLMHSLGDEFGRTWDFSDGSMCGFTHFSGVENVKVFDGRLTFTMNTKEAVLGWGNYQETQENGDKILFWPVRNAVRLRVRQSIGESDWDCTLWSEGKGDSPLRYFDVNSDSAHLAGSEWCDITFEGTQNGADGFELKIESIPGNRIEIDRVEIFRPEATGFFRRSFEIPANDQVWRCIGIIASGTSLYVNGRKIYSGASNIQDNIGAISLDLTP